MTSPPASLDLPQPKLSQLRRIVWTLWDPIGLHSERDQCDDEYDRYILRAASLLGDGSAPEEVVRYLIEIEAEHMGLGVSDSARERAEATVDATSVYLERLSVPVRRIALDAANWQTEQDLWNDLLAALKAPAWHGHNYDALWETITEAAVFGRAAPQLINGVQPPFEIVVRNLSSDAAALRQRLEGISKLLDEAREEFDMEVGLRVDDPPEDERPDIAGANS